MQRKWLKAIKRFIELFTPGGTEYTRSGVAIIFSHTGDSRIPESDWEKLLFNYMDESKRSASRLQEHRNQPGTVGDLVKQ
jgi:hypothetical protein